MVVFLQFFLYFTAVLAAGLSLYNSIKSKRTTEGKKRGLYHARMNMAMGYMLVSFGIVQLFLHEFDSWVRVGVGFIFLLIGLFNLFAGIRNHTYFGRN